MLQGEPDRWLRAVLDHGGAARIHTASGLL